MKLFKQIIRKLLFDNTCSVCGKSSNREGFLCLECLKALKKEAYLKNVGRNYFSFYYKEDIRNVITDYKLRNKKNLSKDLAYIIKEAVWNLLEKEKIDKIISVPISEDRLKERGFNQVDEILDSLFLTYDKIKRKKNTKKMYLVKDKKERSRNIEGAFEINLNLDNKKILIFDDIVTTGATINEIISEIKKNYKNVDFIIYSIAISEKFTLEKNRGN